MSYSTKKLSKNDEYFTPKIAWQYIADYIPKDKLIWEAFYGNGQSAKYLRELGFNVVCDDIDFYSYNIGDIIITNPPFSDTMRIMMRLKELDKPFILLIPSARIHAQYVKRLFGDLQILVPPKRIQFNDENKCSFDCLYFCWKMGFEKDFIFL